MCTIVSCISHNVLIYFSLVDLLKIIIFSADKKFNYRNMILLFGPESSVVQNQLWLNWCRCTLDGHGTIYVYCADQ